MKLIYKNEKNISKRIKEIRFSAKGDANDVGEDSPSDSEENPEDSTEISKEPLEDNSEGEVQNEDKNEELSDLSDVPEDSLNKDNDFEYLREEDPVNDKEEEDFEYLKESDSFNSSKDSSDFDYLRETDPLENSEDPNDFDFLKEADHIKEENSGDSDYLREEESNLDGEDDNNDYDYLREDGNEGLENSKENQKNDLEDDIGSDAEEDPEQENEREALDNLTKELEEAKDSIYAGDLLVSRSDAERMGDEGFEDFLNRDDHDKDEIEDYNEYLKYRDKLNDSAGENEETNEETSSSLERDDTNESIDDHKKDTKMHDPFTSESDEEGEEPVLHGSRGQYTVQEVVKKESEQETIQDQKNEENEAREEIKEKNDLNKSEEEPSDSEKEEEETIKDKKQNDSEEKVEENQEEEEINKESNDFHKKKQSDIEAVKDSSDDLQERKRLKEVEEFADEELKKREEAEEEKRLEEYAEEYRSETEGKRPFYARKMTKDFEKWLKKKKLEEERLEKENQREAIKESKEKKLFDDTSGSKKDKQENQAYDKELETKIEDFTEKEVVKEADKEINLDDKLDKDEKEHPWSKMLKKWIDEEKSEKATKKSKKELKRIIDKFHEIKKKHNRYQWLINKLLRKSISKSEYEELKKLEGELECLSLRERELFKNLIAFRKFYEDNRFWYKSNIRKAREKFTKFLFKKLEDLKDAFKKEKENELGEVLQNQKFNRKDSKDIERKKAIEINNEELEDQQDKFDLILEEILNSKSNDIVNKFKKIFINKYLKYSFKLLSDAEILSKIKDYKSLFNKLCRKYAKKLKELLEKDYIEIIFESNNYISKLFGKFRVDKALRSILVKKESNLISPKKIEKMIDDVVGVRRNMDSLNTQKKQAFIKILKFLRRYLFFSKNFYRNGFNTIFSQIHFANKSKNQLESRSWLIENLRDVFPRLFKIPLNNTLLTFYLFGDVPRKNRDTKLIKFLKIDRRYRRPHPYELFSIEYRINNLSVDDFKNKNIDINIEDLKILQKKVSRIIFEYVFSNNYKKSYISEKTISGIHVGKYYFIPEYFLIKNLYFVSNKLSSNDSLTVDIITEMFDLGKTMGDYLTTGCALGVENLRKIENKITHSDIDKKDKENILLEINRFKKFYFKRQDILSNSTSFSSHFQKKVHQFFENIFNVNFSKDKSIQYITGVDFEFQNKKIKIYPGLHFDGYKELKDDLKQKLGLDPKWDAIAFEAHGTWHKDRKEYFERWNYSKADRETREFIDKILKPTICKDYSIIYLVIFEDDPPEEWLNIIIEQFYNQTGVQLSTKDFPLKP